MLNRSLAKNKDYKILWKPHPGPQTRVLKSTAREILYGGARGGGKTEAGIAWLTRHFHNPNYRFLVIRKNYKDLSDWLDRARAAYNPLGAKISGNPATIQLPSGAKGLTGHMKDANAYEQYQGHEYQRHLIEELTHIPREVDYKKLISSCRTKYPEIPSRIFCTTNPGNAGHGWVKKRFVDHGKNLKFADPKTGQTRIFIPARIEDNPTLLESDPEYVASLHDLPEKLKKMWLYGDWDVFEGQFFDAWSEELHVYEPFDIPKAWPRFRAIDWGYSDPFCCLWFAVGPDNHIWVYREFYRNRMTDGEYAEQIKTLSKYPDGTDERIEYTVGDPMSFSVKVPETGKTRFETFSYNGIYVVPADNNRVEGWSRVREYLEPRDYIGGKSAWVHVSRECFNLIESMPALVHHETRKEDIVDGMEDHAPDTLRYGLRSRPPMFERKEKTGMTNLEWAERQMEKKLSQGVDRWA